MTQKSPSMRLAAPPPHVPPEVADLLDPVALEARLVQARARRADALARRNGTNSQGRGRSPRPVADPATTVPPIIRPAASLAAPPRSVPDPLGRAAPAIAPTRNRVPMATMFLAGLGLGLGAAGAVQAPPSFRERLAGWISANDAAPPPPAAGIAVENDTGSAGPATPSESLARAVGPVEETPGPSTEASPPAAGGAAPADAAPAPPPAAKTAAPLVAEVASPVDAPAPSAAAASPEQPPASRAGRAAAPAPDMAVRIAALAAPNGTALAPPPLGEVALPIDAPTPLAAAPSPAQPEAPGAVAAMVAPASDAAVRVVALDASRARPAVDQPYDLEPPATPPAASPSAALPAATPGSASQDLSALAGGTRVFVHHPPGARAAAEAAASGLRQAGLGEATIIAAPHVVSRTNVRFFHDNDAGAARDVALLLAATGGAAPDIRDFTDYSPRPRPGIVEIWLAGDVPAAAPQRSPTTPAPVAAAPTSPATPPGGDDVRRVVEEVVRDRATIPAPTAKVEPQSLRNSTWFDREVGRVFRRLGW